MMSITLLLALGAIHLADAPRAATLEPRPETASVSRAALLHSRPTLSVPVAEIAGGAVLGTLCWWAIASTGFDGVLAMAAYGVGVLIFAGAILGPGLVIVGIVTLVRTLDKRAAIDEQLRALPGSAPPGLVGPQPTVALARW